MLKKLKVKHVFEHVAESVLKFMSEIVTLQDCMISVKLPTLETITNCRNCIIDEIQNFSYQDRD